jgi:hypothetical protein
MVSASKIPKHKDCRNTGALARGLLFFFLSIAVASASAQPGWHDFSRRYTFQLLNEYGNPIVFTGNRQYSIAINGKVFTGQNIPHDSLGPIRYMSDDFIDAIRINDFALKRPLNRDQLPVISIARGADTMYLWPAPDLTVRFAPGHFYFTPWARHLLKDGGFSARGRLRIVNQEQRVFSVPGALFNRALKNWQRAGEDELEAMVNRQVAQPFFQLTRTEQAVVMEPSLHPFKNKRWDGPIFPSSDSQNFVGLFSASYNHDNSSWSVGTVGRFNRMKNRVDFWLPRPDPMLYFIARLFRNPFTGEFYASGGVRDSAGPEGSQTDFERFPYNMGVYRANAAAQHWKWMSALQGRTGSEVYEHVDFPDAQHTLAFFRRYPPGEKAMYRTQGVFYLLRDDRIIDSFITPAKSAFDDNYNGYGFERLSDAEIRVGHWGLTGTVRADMVTHILLKRSGAIWNFTTQKETEAAFWERQQKTLPEAQVPVALFRQFRIDSSRLVIPTGALDLKEPPLKVLERGSFICLLYADGFLFSRDGGHDWFYYPGFHDRHSEFNLLDGDSSGHLWFWDTEKMLRITLHLSLKH